jgi:hypothetical protein
MDRALAERLADIPRVRFPSKLLVGLAVVAIQFAFVEIGRIEVAWIGFAGLHGLLGFLVAWGAWYRRSQRRKLRALIDSRLEKLGVTEPAGDSNSATVPFPFLGHRDSLARRALNGPRVAMIILAIVYFGILLIGISDWFRFTNSPRGSGFVEDILGIAILVELIVFWVVSLAMMWHSARRADRETGLWRALGRATRGKHANATLSISTWPLLLFGYDWYPNVDGLRDAWMKSDLAIQERDPKFRALERVVGWLRDVRLMRHAVIGEKELYRTVLREVAWGLATKLDPSLEDDFAHRAQAAAPIEARGALA